MSERDLFDDFREPDWGEPGPAHVFRGRGANRLPTLHAPDAAPFPDAPLSDASELIPGRTKTAICRSDGKANEYSLILNPYRGCALDCAHCFARPAHARLGYSPELDFAKRIVFEPDLAPRLRRELGRSGYRCAPIAIGTETDAWQPAERTFGITRAVLEVCLEARQPIEISTRSTLILRDLDLLRALASRCLVNVSISLTTLDELLSRRLEPHAPTPRQRLSTLKTLAESGIPSEIRFSPAIPALTDQEMEAILAAGAEAGAVAANFELFRLADDLAPLFRRWLSTHAPERAKRVLAVLYDLRDKARGKSGSSPAGRGLEHFSELLGQRFRQAVRRYGLASPTPLDNTQFRRPRADLPGSRQPGLF